MSRPPNVGSGTKAIAGLFIVALVAVLVHYVVLFPYSSESEKLPFQQTRFNAVAQEVQQGLLKPDAAGSVTLPPDLASATSNGKVYVTHTSNGPLLIYFPTWWGRNWMNHVINYKGWVYCSRPLTQADKTGIWEADDAINLNAPSIDCYRQFPKKWPVAWAKWYCDSKINPNWYAVASDDNEI